jgi:hypothetical protein
MPDLLQDALDRLVAMEKEALDTITGTAVDAVDYWPYEQDAFPYFTNRLGPMTLTDDEYGEDISLYTYNILIRLVTDHITAGYKGDKSDLTTQYIVIFETYLRTHPMLATDGSAFGDYTAVPDFLFQEARLIAHTGLVVFQNTGTGTLQIGCEFTLEVAFLRSVS